jgi:hypothetical protein
MRMKVTHEMTFARRCPVDDALDHYELCVETTRTVKVEDILAAIEALPEKSFQEEITAALAAKLGCSVTTVGYHSGVKTTCVV